MTADLKKGWCSNCRPGRHSLCASAYCERAGMEVAWLCEADAYCRGVLRRHWPDSPIYDDVRTLPDDVEPVDLVCGGFPCQPFSLGGLRKGVADERWGWPWFADVVRRLRPRYVVLENVAALLADRAAFGTVLADLHLLGFDAEWSVVPACALGAPHPRERLFVVAHPAGRHVPDQVPPRQRPAAGAAEPRGSRRSTRGDGWLPEPPMDRVAYGLPFGVVRDPLHALGNAVVPQVAELIGLRVMSMERAA